MLWIGVCEAVSIAMIGGVVGSCLMAIANKANNKWNVEKMEDCWREDVFQFRGSIQLAHSKIEELERKLSTISVIKPVGSTKKGFYNKGYKNQRHFNHG